MRYIGQLHIMKRLVDWLPTLYENPDMGINMLFRGPSGYGKTTLALAVAHYLADKDFEMYWAEWTEWKFKKRVIFIDEIHRVADLEKLYGIMDEKKHVFLFATNHDANLPEAFVNRCREFIFDDYHDDELLLIARESSTFRASDEQFMHVIEAGNRNPRIIKGLIDELGNHFSRNSIDSTKANFKEILENQFEIVNGLDTLARRYLEVLEDVGGTASINLLKSTLHIDEGTLKNTVEPVLLRKGLVKITAKGRTRIYD
jgi:Holliday junction resolvasome RuvABC ATP-dependent DNA helicase subunit